MTNHMMIAAAGFLALTGFLPGPAAAQGKDGYTACLGLATQSDISSCVSAHHETTERLLTTAYQIAIQTQVANDEPLRVSQRAWIQRREVDCEAERAVFDGGSGEGSALGSCLARWNEARTQGLLSLNEGQVSIPGLDGYDAPEG